MHKFIWIYLVSSLLLLAREEKYPIKECQAFNNMKHTKNSKNILLDISKKYLVIKYHKGQALIVIKGVQPAQRWVDGDCFSSHTNKDNVKLAKSKVISIINPKESTTSSKSTSKSTKNLLALSWHNAFCETHRYKKECKSSLFSILGSRYKEKNFVLHGLWPQPRTNVYCNVSKEDINRDKHKQWNKLYMSQLSIDTKKRLQKVMPGFSSNLHKHEWIKHGTCYGKSSDDYYKDAVSLLEQLSESKVGDFFRKNIGKQVTLRQTRMVFNRSFGVGSGKSVELRCKKGLIVELWLHLDGDGDSLGTLLKSGKPIRSRCQKGLLDRSGF